MKKRARKRFLSKYDGKKYGWFLMCRDFVLMLAGVSLLFSLLVGVSRVDGVSMDPTLRDGQVVFFTRVNLGYSRGDVVYARMPSGENYVKRVVALEGDVVELDSLRFEVFSTPGHTPGGVSLRCQDALFTGDTLFCGSCGRTDFPGGDMDQQLLSLKKLCLLEGDYEVYPGHMDQTTLERERQFNYYCRMAMDM